LPSKFITLENFENIKNKFAATLENAIKEMSQKVRDLQIDFCKIGTEIKYLLSKQNDLEDFCHDNDRRIELLDKDLQTVNKTLICLKYEVKDIAKNEHNVHHELEVLREELNSIKCVKADQELVESHNESKADKVEVAKKVSYTTFEPVRKHLINDLIAAQEKIIDQETKLQQKIMQLSIQVASECEIIKEKFNSVIDKITEKCQQLETNVNALKEIRVTAASTVGYMSNLNCLVCADIAKMKRSEECLPMQKPFKQQLNKSQFKGLKFVDEREKRKGDLEKQHYANERHSNYFDQNKTDGNKQSDFQKIFKQ
jgi:chromosome segregation ATPase